MSNIPNYNPNDFPAARPQHHLHDSSEPLPGAGGTKATTDYDMNADTNQYRAGSGPQDRLAEYGNSAPESTTLSSQDRPAQVSFEDQTRGYDPAGHDTGASARGSEGLYQEKPLGDRPLGVQPAGQGGVAVGGRENQDMPMGQAGLGDKMIGKTQKVMGKMMNNPEMHERGELREAGGRSAASGSARAPHD